MEEYTNLYEKGIHRKDVVVKIQTDMWYDCRGFYTKKNYKFLKRKSDPNSLNHILEDLSCGGVDSLMKTLINKDASDGIYKLYITNISTDWETGYVDDYDWELEKI